MTYEQIETTINELKKIVMQPITFNNITIELLDVLRAKHSPDWFVLPHYHPWFEFNYIAKGSFYTTISDKTFLAQSNDSFLIAPEIVHSHKNAKCGDDGICIRFRLCATDNNHTIYNTLCAMRADVFNSEIEKIKLCPNIISLQAEFVAWIMRIYDQQSETVIDVTPVSDTLSAQVNLYLEEYYSKKINVNDIARALNMSYRTLARKFKDETGVTITEQLNSLRIEKAKILLKDSNLPIYNIAALTGYYNEFHFSTAFKQATKMSPSTYRHTL